MKNNSTVQKKLKSYSAIAGTIAAAVSSADAQVIYTNVTPDSVVSSGGIYNLDLNNDGVTDFKIEQASGTFYGYAFDAVRVYAAAANNAVDTSGSGGMGVATAFDVNAMVDASLLWVDSTQAYNITPAPTANVLGALIPDFSLYFGNFIGAGEKYLPLRFNIGVAGPYYGWVRLDVAGDALSFKVLDYAYTNIPGTSYSITGAMVGISEAAKNGNISIFSYDNNITVKLDPNVAVEGTIAVTNLLGQTITEQTITNTETVIPMNAAKAGIYLVTVKQSNGSYTKRVSVK
jgi:hypothetical protein